MWVPERISTRELGRAEKTCKTGTYIHTLSATPESRPRRQRRRISSWLSLSSWSLDMDAPVGLAFVGVFCRERCRMRSYRAWRRELVGVWGTVCASGPRWWTGVDGIDESEAVGVSLPAREGVRALVGVRGSRASVRECRDEGVWGNRRRFVVGVFMIRFVEGVPSRLEGVTGKGTAKSRSFLLGDLVGERDAYRVGEPGGCGAARIEAEAGDLGEEEASSRVRFDGFATSGNAGSSAIGIWGTDSSLA